MGYKLLNPGIYRARTGQCGRISQPTKNLYFLLARFILIDVSIEVILLFFPRALWLKNIMKQIALTFNRVLLSARHYSEH